MTKRTLAILALSVLVSGCALGKFQDSPQKEMTLDGFPMMLRVVHEGSEFEIMSGRWEFIYLADNPLRDKKLATTVADSEATAICGQKKPHLIDREKPEGSALWFSRYRCD